MVAGVFPTKGNLLKTKKSLRFSRLGFDLLDRKRNILVREMMTLIGAANRIQGQIDQTFSEAYLALQQANITLGTVSEIVEAVPVEDAVEIHFRSVMGIEIPMVTLEEKAPEPFFGLNSTNSLFDEAYIKFDSVKQLIIMLAEIENSIYRLANAIKKTQKRANALKNILIPGFEDTVKFIADSLDEKDREEFSRLKVIKKQKKGGSAEA